MYKCTKCSKEKESSDFYLKSSKTGKVKMSECKDCHKSRMIKRTRENAEYIFSIVGDKCSVCGYNKCSSALELHHLDPNTKEFNLSKSRSYSKEAIDKEIKKCILLCSNCHREVHAGLLNLGH